MKKTVLTSIMILAWSVSVIGQTTRYYETSQYYSLGAGVVYKCDVDRSLAELFNASNKFHGVRMAYADGRQIVRTAGDIFPKTYTMTREVHYAIQSKAKTVFTAEQKALLKDDIFIVDLFLDPSTGRVMEVEFSFSIPGRKVSLIPPSTFRELELALKDGSIVVQPTEFGRTLNYLPAGYTVEF